jgi:vancomycin resistance protein YoaR
MILTLIKKIVLFLLSFLIILGGYVRFAQAQAQSTTTNESTATTTPLLLRGNMSLASATTSTTSETSQIVAVTAAIAKPVLPKFDLNYQDQKFTIDQDTLTSWQESQSVTKNNLLLTPSKSLKDSLLESLGQSSSPQNNIQTYGHRLDLIYNYIQTIAEKIDEPVQEPVLTITDNHVATFTPPQLGISVDIYNSALDALKNLQTGQSSSSLVSYQVLPQNSLASTNDLGINELIAEGTSKFNGSPKNRRWNIAVGVEKMKGIIVPQGGEFSFDDNLGPVDGEHGFLPELVIKGNNTLPEFGGGLCQVSTTAFRAAMAGGLPITARRNHAYAVQYYAPQGTDATIYPGSADLKFVNDTPGAILIWPYEKDANTLIFDFYGTKDSRQVTLEKPVVYDRTSEGAMKATWTREVTNGGQTRTDVFKSNYQPPALFHHTESFVSTTGTPISGLKIPTKVQ